jgi:hypothetical protein
VAPRWPGQGEGVVAWLPVTRQGIRSWSVDSVNGHPERAEFTTDDGTVVELVVSSIVGDGRRATSVLCALLGGDPIPEPPE